MWIFTRWVLRGWWPFVFDNTLHFWIDHDTTATKTHLGSFSHLPLFSVDLESIPVRNKSLLALRARVILVNFPFNNASSTFTSPENIPCIYLLCESVLPLWIISFKFPSIKYWLQYLVDSDYTSPHSSISWGCWVCLCHRESHGPAANMGTLVLQRSSY